MPRQERSMRKALFLDRDGLINVDSGYVGRIEDFKFIDGIAAALRHAQLLGYRLIVVTNQSGIGRGYYSEADFTRLTHWMVEQLARQGVAIDAVYHCPHTDEDHCECRKPKPGMLLRAIDKFDLDCDNSWMIGDSERDIEAARAVGIRHTVLYDADNGSTTSADYQISSLAELQALLC
jgi:D-glycero-D-manno-heptose 1,7-bisphosphate phosphatase